MAGAMFLTVITPAYLKAPKPLFILVVIIDIALWMIVGLDLGIFAATLKPVVGYLLFAAGWIALYIVGSLVNNHIFGRTVLPMFGSFIK